MKCAPPLYSPGADTSAELSLDKSTLSLTVGGFSGTLVVSGAAATG